MNAAVRPTSGARSILPLLDRQAELEVLARSVDAAAAGEGRVVLVEGGPGAGKTRLLTEVRELAARAGLRVLSARGGEIEREYPYGAVRQLFEAALLSPDGASWLEGPAAAASSAFNPDAISSELTPDERDRRHARAAELLYDRAADPNQVGAHLMMARPRGLSWMSEALLAAAADASQRGAVESAITFLRRAHAERPVGQLTRATLSA